MQDIAIAEMVNRSPTFLDRPNDNELTVVIALAVYGNAMVRPIETPSLTTREGRPSICQHERTRA
jgi:hypothetical protein